MKNKIIYEAFGDASTGSSGTFYGFVLFPEDKIEEIVSCVNAVKEKFLGTANSRIHCRELFGEHSRKKSEWAHLDLQSVENLLRSIFDAIDTFEPEYVLGMMPTDTYPETFRLRGKGGHPDLIHTVDDKWRELWTYHRAATLLNPVNTIPPPDPKKDPTPDSAPRWQMIMPQLQPAFEVRKIFLDREKTKVHWFSKKFLWSTLAKELVLRTPHGETYLPIQPDNETKHPLLDIADLFVWNISRSMSSKPIELRSTQATVHTVAYLPRGKEITIG